MSRRDAVVASILLIAFVALPFVFSESAYMLDLGVLTFLFISQAIAWNLLGGYAGQVSFGYAAFFGIGAYSTGVLWLQGWPPLLTLPVGAFLAALFALIVGLLLFEDRDLA